ncbi:glycoside hydrolase family 19 protein, partial [Streptomyces sp. NPDC006193]|uniref:glycoside hydrolase family 19 protein n=1 Tax=Streptomyces sp. NPDC006193 TaxID=3155717 RepID=UPI0033A2A72B
MRTPTTKRSIRARIRPGRFAAALAASFAVLCAVTPAQAADGQITAPSSATTAAAPAGGSAVTAAAGFVVSEAQFNQMFPNRNGFYTYSGLTAALSAYPGFANTGDDATKKREAAAFLANV